MFIAFQTALCIYRTCGLEPNVLIECCFNSEFICEHSCRNAALDFDIGCKMSVLCLDNCESCFNNEYNIVNLYSKTSTPWTWTLSMTITHLHIHVGGKHSPVILTSWYTLIRLPLFSDLPLTYSQMHPRIPWPFNATSCWIRQLHKSHTSMLKRIEHYPVQINHYMSSQSRMPMYTIVSRQLSGVQSNWDWDWGKCWQIINHRLPISVQQVFICNRQITHFKMRL